MRIKAKLDINSRKLNLCYTGMGLSSNMEDYIEAIFILNEDNKIVRVKDIAKKLNIKMPSVSAALNKLKDIGLILYEKYSYIELTEHGEQLADNIRQRHICLWDFFHNVLKLCSDEAETVACKLEHDIPPVAFNRINKFVEFYKSEETKNSKWISDLKNKISEK